MIIKDKYKFVGVDLDGTLLKNNKDLSPANKSAIKLANEKGIYIVPITGRPFSGIPSCILELDEIEYIITSNGAEIVRLADNKTIYSAPISNDKSVQLLNEATKRGFYIEVFADRVGYIEPMTMELHKKRYEGTPIYDYLSSSRRVVDSVCSLFSDDNKCADEIFLTANSTKKRDEFLEIISADSSLEACILGDNYLEITKRGTNKGEAMTFLCDYLGVDKNSTIVFGDGENDFSFFNKAAFSVAMENANASLKQIADYVTLSNDNDGVAEILKLL